MKNEKIDAELSKTVKLMVEEMRPMVEQLKQLSKIAHQGYEIEVQKIIFNKVNNENKIELTLDHILDFCFDEQMLLLYKTLCRYYWDINPVATADYVNYYREMWDNE